MLHPGLYEQVINRALKGELSEIPEARKSVAPIDQAEASKVLAQYLADVVQKALDNMLDNGGTLASQVELTNQIVSLIQRTTQESDFAALSVDQRAEQLLALLRENDPSLAVGRTAADMKRPETSIAQSSLFTGAVHEPQMVTELKEEIVSADRIDMLVSFIKWSGLRLIIDELREFTQNGGALRIIITSYMGATDVKAIEELRKLSNTLVKVSYGNTAGLIARIASFTEDSGQALTLANFLDYTHLDPRALYRFSSFSRLCVRADVREDFSEPLEETMTKALLRLSVLDSRRLIAFLLDILPRLNDVDFAALPDVQQRMLRMFMVTVWGVAAEDLSSDETLDRLYALADSPVMLGELMELLRYRYEQIDFIDEPVEVGFDCPLDLHCTYTRDQLLVALDFMKPATVREGVKWLPDKKIDVLLVTLNKSDKDYSPTTMYNDYSISESLFHWQSQSTTAEQSPAGQRYIHHRELGSRVLLFVREFKTDSLSGGAAAYTFLGTANYLRHEGSRPMNITWKLDRPIPAKFLKKTNKLVVG